jgi:hypothetical protein
MDNISVLRLQLVYLYRAQVSMHERTRMLNKAAKYYSSRPASEDCTEALIYFLYEQVTNEQMGSYETDFNENDDNVSH